MQCNSSASPAPEAPANARYKRTATTTATVSHPPIPFGFRHEQRHPTQLHWWQKPFANVQTNLQEIDATMDVEKALDVIEAHGANSWLLNTVISRSTPD